MEFGDLNGLERGEFEVGSPIPMPKPLDLGQCKVASLDNIGEILELIELEAG